MVLLASTLALESWASDCALDDSIEPGYILDTIGDYNW